MSKKAKNYVMKELYLIGDILGSRLGTNALIPCEIW